MFDKMQKENPCPALVRGYHYHLTFGNGYREYGWSAVRLKRGEAITALLDFANCGDFYSDWEDGKKVFAYDRDCIERYWVTKSDTRWRES